MAKPNKTIEFLVDADEFEHYVGRYPKNKAEFEQFFHYYKNGLDTQIDWEIIGKSAAELMKK
jgi:hypothetical protein